MQSPHLQQLEQLEQTDQADHFDVLLKGVAAHKQRRNKLEWDDRDDVDRKPAKGVPLDDLFLIHLPHTWWRRSTGRGMVSTRGETKVGLLDVSRLSLALMRKPSRTHGRVGLHAAVGLVKYSHQSRSRNSLS